MDRVKELETAIAEAIRLMANAHNYDASTILRAALAPAEKVPLTCPKCQRELVRLPNVETDNTDKWICHKGCDWQQPGSAQRPKMPEPREGYHPNGEWRSPLQNERYYPGDDEGLLKATMNHTGPDRFWIFVQDAPVSEAVVFSTSSFCEGCSNYVSKFCVVSLAFCKGCQGGSKNDKDAPVSEPVLTANRQDGVCGICGIGFCLPSGKCDHCDADHFAMKTVQVPSPVKVPVVEYYRTAIYLYRVVDGKCDEVIEPARNGVYKQTPWEVVCTLHPQITHEDYEAAREAARKPAKPAIEPLGYGSNGDEIVDAFNHLIERNNDLEKRVNAKLKGDAT